jgi:hypothetical protein
VFIEFTLPATTDIIAAQEKRHVELSTTGLSILKTLENKKSTRAAGYGNQAWTL